MSKTSREAMARERRDHKAIAMGYRVDVGRIARDAHARTRGRIKDAQRNNAERYAAVEAARVRIRNILSGVVRDAVGAR